MRSQGVPGKRKVLIPSVMALRETAMTAPLGQQGEPWAANGRPYLLFRRFSENCMRPHPALRATFSFQGKALRNGLPHQCAHWFAMTCGIRSASKKCERPHPALRATFPSQGKALGEITGRENPALLFYFSTTGGWSGDRWSPHPDSRCSGATGQYWRCPGKR